MALAPPVSRGNFYYDGHLYVEVGSLNRHQRATVEEITAILRPDLKKAKKASVDPPKDQVGHWYEAQLIHYGLPPSKDKARAKMRLLEALNQSRIVVPPNISGMEAEMKKEYAAAERKAKAQHKASTAPTAKIEPLAAGKKRKQPEPSGNTNNINVNISFGNGFGPSGSINATDSQPSAKKAKTGPSNPTKKKTEKAVSSQPSKKTTDPGVKQPLSQASPVAKRPPQTARKTVGKPSSSSEAKRPVQTARKIVDKGSSKPPKKEGETQIKKEPSVKKETTVKKEAKVKKEPSTKPPPKIKHEPPTDSSRTPNTPSLGLINGIYDLSCPTVETEWNCTSSALTLALDGTTVWGAYDLGMFSGILCLPHRPWSASTDALPFTWRGRENGEGEMSFGEGCEGEISFLGNGRIEGWIGVYGRCGFEGVKRGGLGGVGAGGLVRGMKGEWEGYCEEAYGEERAMRWG